MNFWSKKLLMAGSGGLFEPITFQPSSALQSWTVPAGINEVMVEAAGSKGCEYNTGGTNPGNYATAGNGGKVICKLKVTPGITLYIWVGAAGSLPDEAVNNSSDIRIGGTALENRVLVAGGGGASGWSDPDYNTYDSSTPAKRIYIAYNGGAGGGDVGGYVGTPFAGTVTQLEGRGGSQTEGGSGSQGSASRYWKGVSGQLGLGGAGGICEEININSYHYPEGSIRGGAGGGGYYGGGGGGAALGISTCGAAGGGGGGSSYTNPNYCSDITSTQGTNNGAGYITISKVE